MITLVLINDIYLVVGSKNNWRNKIKNSDYNYDYEIG